MRSLRASQTSVEHHERKCLTQKTQYTPVVLLLCSITQQELLGELLCRSVHVVDCALSGRRILGGNGYNWLEDKNESISEGHLSVS